MTQPESEDRVEQIAATAGEDSRSFEMRWKSRKRGEEDETRTVTLWADLGALEDIRDCDELPLDLLSGGESLVDVFQQPVHFARVLYELSDAQDMEPKKFARGLTGDTFAKAAAALRGALRAFFLKQHWLTHVKVLDEGEATMRETQLALVDAMEQVNPSQLISETLRGDEFVSNVEGDLRNALDHEVQKMRGASSTQQSDDSG